MMTAFHKYAFDYLGEMLVSVVFLSCSTSLCHPMLRTRFPFVFSPAYFVTACVAVIVVLSHLVPLPPPNTALTCP